MSYYAELPGPIVLHHVAPDRIQPTWGGDNETGDKLYKQGTWGSRTFDAMQGEDSSARRAGEGRLRGGMPSALCHDQLPRAGVKVRVVGCASFDAAKIIA